VEAGFVLFLISDAANFPLLMSDYTTGYGTDIGTSLTKWVYQETVLTSINYPVSYQPGLVYFWIINFKDEGFVKLVFTQIALNVYEV
jgi:hypothetical protein